ncbi:MAG TPA: beta-propeller fold lactonase family protein, partial [Chitinophagaceae bacterium]|nr:beta-propeller fold lactonase family protein [Chitinophagaceae bacterium]
FGFAADHFGNIYVSEAVGGAAGASTVSSYHISFNGDITLTEGPVGAGQSAACWVVLTGNDQYAYVTNAASNNISSFSIQPHSGNLDVLEADAAGADGGPIDAALTKNSKYLYVLNSGGHSISAYEVSNNGGLTSIGTVGSLPMGTNGLAAR